MQNEKSIKEQLDIINNTLNDRNFHDKEGVIHNNGNIIEETCADVNSEDEVQVIDVVLDVYGPCPDVYDPSDVYNIDDVECVYGPPSYFDNNDVDADRMIDMCKKLTDADLGINQDDGFDDSSVLDI